MFDRSFSVGTELRASGRSCTSSFWSLGATGFESSTSGLRSSSALRRLTNVVLARRMKPGSCCSDEASGTRWAASASVVVARCWISALRSELLRPRR